MTPYGITQRWAPWWRRCTVVQPWTCLWVVRAPARLRCDVCHRQVSTRQCVVATFPSRADWQHGNLGSPKTGEVYCGNCAHVWYGVWETDLQPPLPESLRWDCWGPLVSLSPLVVEGPVGYQRYAYRLSPHWRDRVHRRASP